MNDIAVCSLGFGKEYLKQIARLEASIAAVQPELELLFWHENYPFPSRTHQESLYGFKVWCINVAKERGFKKIIWLDTACILQHPVDYYFKDGMPPVIAIQDDNLLSNFIGDKALAYYGITDQYMDERELHLIGGSLYVFDFNYFQTNDVFKSWMAAEKANIFGSQAEQSSGLINKHRHDESCLSMALFDSNIKPVSHEVGRYNTDENSIIIKKHFK